MAPLCSNCGGTEFVWAGELKTGGRFGQGPLALRSGGELPLGTRICRSCGHADLFLRDTAILSNPHHWRPNEFVPISSPARDPSKSTPPAPVAPTDAPARAPAPSDPEPVERPIFVDALSATPPAEPAPPSTPSPAPSGSPPASGSGEAPAESAVAAKKPARRRTTRAKKSTDE